MKIAIYQNREVEFEDSKIGNDSENKVETLEFEFPEQYKDFTKYIEFLIKGQKHVDLIENNKYTIPRKIVQQGKIKTQIVLKKTVENDELVFKSNIFVLNVSASINAVQQVIDNTDPLIIQRIVTNLERVDENVNQLELDVTSLQNENETNKEKISNLKNDIEKSKQDILELQTMKVDKIEGKELSTNDFTNEYRQKLEKLENYDDTLVKQEIEKIKATDIKQDSEININKTNIEQLQKDNTTNKQNISEIKQEQITQNTDIENIKKSNEEKAKEIDSLKKELEQTKTNLENYAIHGKSTGEYIHLTDSSETDCRVDVKGNAKQVVTEQSANTLDLTKLSITEKPNIAIDDISANEVTFHTTNNNASSYYLRFKTILKKGTYYARKLYNLIDGTAVTGNNGSGAIFISKSDWSKEFIRLYPNVEKGSFSLQEDAEVYITLMLGKVENGKIRFYNLMLANSDVEYTPFVPASPSLEYPSKIETVGSNKNIFNILKYDYRFYFCGSAEVRDNSNFRIIATKSTDQNCSVMFKILDLTKYAGKTLTIQAFAKSSTNTNKAFIVLRQNNFDYTGTKTNELYDETQNTTNGVIKLKYKVTDTINDNNKYLFIAFYATRGNVCAVGDYVDYEVKIEEGSVATSYSKFGQGSVKVTARNKNMVSLFDYEIGGFDMTTGQPKGGITAQARSKVFHKVNPNTQYSISSKDVNQITYLEYDKNKNYVGFTGWIDGNSATFTTRENTYFIKELVRNTNIVIDKINKLTEIQLERGTATEYQVHKEDSVVLPVQEEMLEGDYLDKVNKKEVHGWGKVILDGSQTIEILGTGKTGIYRFAVTINGIKTGDFNVAETINNLISDKLIVGSNNDTYQAKKDNTMHMRVNNKPQVIIYIEKCSKMTVDEFANFLSKNNIELYYKLAEPKKLDLTQEQIQALEKLDKLKTYKNITNITTDSIAILDVDYKKDLETLLNQITKESEV